MACFRVGTRWNGTPLYIWILVDIEKALKARPSIFSTILVVVEDAKIFLTTSYAFEIVSRTKPVVVSFETRPETFSVAFLASSARFLGPSPSTY
jgi:hypothetical protein